MDQMGRSFRYAGFKLRDWATELEFLEKNRAYPFLDVEIVANYDDRFERFSGKGRWVFTWILLENGWAVGRNENPSIGTGYVSVGPRYLRKYYKEKDRKDMLEFLGSLEKVSSINKEGD